jgi:anaerobic magnesium-protoporphyrin IX monomethyl ester cyclase
MPGAKNSSGRVLLVTGFSPVTPPQMVQMGMIFESFPKLLSLLGKDVFRFSIPSVGPAVLASYLVKHKIDVEVKDYFIDPIDFSEYDIIGVSSTFLQDNDGASIVKEAKTKNPRAVVILGGPISWSVSPGELMSAMPDLDIIVVKGGEQTLVELVNRIRRSEDLGSVKSLVLRADDRNIIETPLRAQDELDEIVSPSWQLLGIPSPVRIPVLPVETSRGCPNNCAYCSEVTYWGKPVRYRPVENVIQEIKDDVNKFGISSFRFTDSCFSAPPDRTARICDAIYDNCIVKGMPIKWSAYARMDNLTQDLLMKMKRSGCVALDLGLESGAETVLKRMGRGYTPDVAVRVAAQARDLGIFVNFNVIVGFPGETKETVLSTTDTINRAKPDSFSCFLLHLPPHTRVSSTSDLFKIEGSGHNWEHETMNSREANEAMVDLVKAANQSTHFPGGEYFACFLASLGFSIDQIRYFFRTSKTLANTPADDPSLVEFKEMLGRLKQYV